MVPFTYINWDVFQGTESVSSLAGADGSDRLTQRAEDDSSSAESPDGASHGKRATSNQDECFILSLRLYLATQPVSVRRQLTVQPVSTPPLSHGHFQPCQLESPSHTANVNGRRAAVGAHGVT